ncbi:type II toxin-antitoxin system RelE family toxin [Brucella sp. IR073]|uniref:type II toxin-antitoxin system RelE family toxin n=1 Tax=unclassified Brucella TaxID=2632610 RepID=UPI003B9863F5
MKQVTYHKEALKTLRRIPMNEARRIRAKIEQYAADPASQVQNIIKLQGREGFRLRVGDWRVIFDENGSVIDVLAIGPRGRIYE